MKNKNLTTAELISKLKAERDLNFAVANCLKHNEQGAALNAAFEARSKEYDELVAKLKTAHDVGEKAQWDDEGVLKEEGK